MRNSAGKCSKIKAYKLFIEIEGNSTPKGGFYVISNDDWSIWVMLIDLFSQNWWFFGVFMKFLMGKFRFFNKFWNFLSNLMIFLKNTFKNSTIPSILIHLLVPNSLKATKNSHTFQLTWKAVIGRDELSEKRANYLKKRKVMMED